MKTLSINFFVWKHCRRKHFGWKHLVWKYFVRKDCRRKHFFYENIAGSASSQQEDRPLCQLWVSAQTQSWGSFDHLMKHLIFNFWNWFWGGYRSLNSNSILRVDHLIKHLSSLLLDWFWLWVSTQTQSWEWSFDKIFDFFAFGLFLRWLLGRIQQIWASGVSLKSLLE